MKYIPTGEAAKLCGVTRETIQNLCRSGAMRHSKRGVFYYVLEEDAIKYRDKIQEISKVSTSIDEYLAIKKKTMRELIDKCNHIGMCLESVSLYPKRAKGAIRFFTWAVSLVDPKITNKEMVYLEHYINGATTKEMAKDKTKSEYLYRKAIKRLATFARATETLQKRIKELEEENDRLYNEKMLVDTAQVHYNVSGKRSLIDMPLENVEISQRLLHALYREDIRTISELAQKSESSISRLRNIGKGTLAESKNILKSFNLRYGMTLDEVIENIRK